MLPTRGSPIRVVVVVVELEALFSSLRPFFVFVSVKLIIWVY